MTAEKNWPDKLKKNILVTEKSARCFTYGEGGEDTRHVWIVMHGYGQLASGVMQHFTGLDPQTHFVVAPEGLSRFYVNGLYGKVGASWMTSEDRELEIKDQLHFLDRVYEQFVSPMNQEKLRIHALGFSQGVATLTRWLVHRKPDIDSIIFWAGTAPFSEIEACTEPFSRVPWYFVIGDEDEFLPEKAVQRHLKNLEEKSGSKIRILRYKGRHRIEAGALSELLKVIGAAS